MKQLLKSLSPALLVSITLFACTNEKERLTELIKRRFLPLSDKGLSISDVSVSDVTHTTKKETLSAIKYFYIDGITELTREKSKDSANLEENLANHKKYYNDGFDDDSGIIRLSFEMYSDDTVKLIKTKRSLDSFLIIYNSADSIKKDFIMAKVHYVFTYSGKQMNYDGVLYFDKNDSLIAERLLN